MISRKIDCLLLVLIASLSTTLSYAEHPYGIAFSNVIIDKDPRPLHGDQVTLSYAPPKFHWGLFNLYFETGFARFQVSSPHYRTIEIATLAPVARFTFKPAPWLSPYVEISAGPSYLNQIFFKTQKLGCHFAFQDKIGIGAIMGKSQAVAVGLHIAHYSNAHLAKHNSGITIPLMLDVQYRFM